MKVVKSKSFSDEFLDGQKCCKDGEKCPNKASTAFVKGFQLEKWSEEQKTALNLHQERHI